MLYSYYYRGRDPQQPTTQEDQAKNAVGQQIETSLQAMAPAVVAADPVPEPEPIPADDTQDLIDQYVEAYKATELLDLAKEASVVVPNGATKPEIAKLLVEASK